MSENKLEILKFAGIAVPTPYESNEKNNDKYVYYGVDNNYPNFLLKLYNESAIHCSIINSKATYILGDGLKFKDGKNVTVKVNAADSFNELISKATKDYLIFNCFAIEVIYNSLKQPIEYHHVPVNRVRCNKSKTKFWVSENWYEGLKPVQFDRWKANSVDATSKIFFYDGYFPSASNVYPIPDYNGNILSIVTDLELKKYNLNNIQNDFSVSSILTFFNGRSNTPEAMKEAYDTIKKSYSGATGGRFILDFQQAEGKAAEVTNISANDWDKKYELTSKYVKEDIMQGHQVTSPALFGIQAEGQLGASTELEVAYEIFQNTYARNKRNELLSAFNLLFSVGELVKGQLDFAEKPLFSARIPDALKEKVYTVNELRLLIGLKPLVDGDKLLTDTKAESTPQPQKMSSDVFTLSEEDFEKIKDMGVVVDEFEFIEEGEFIKSKEDFNRVELHFETLDEVAKYILDNKIEGSTVADLKSSLRKDLGINVSISELKGMLAQLNKSGILNTKVDADGKVNINPTEKSTRKIEVLYSYDVRPGYGKPIEENTRAFCKKLVTNNRFYSREEIQNMSSIFGYDIFSYGGGYYRNPTTGDLTSHCRHNFKAVTVSRKNKK